MELNEWQENQEGERRRLDEKRREREQRKAKAAAPEPEEFTPDPAEIEIDLPDTDDPRELAKAATVSAIKTLVSVALDPTQSANARVSAANSLIDRGHGKVEQSITAVVESKLDPSDITDLARRMRFLMAMAQNQAIESQPIEVVPEKDDDTDQ